MAEGGGLQEIIDIVLNISKEGEGDEETKTSLKELADIGDESTEDVEQGLNQIADQLGITAKEADEVESSFMEATGQGLALLFAGRFLTQTFGGLSRTMRDMVGITDVVSGTMKGILAPTFASLTPIVAKISEFFLNLGDDTQQMIAIFVILGAIIAPIIMIFGQLAAMAAAFGTTVGVLIAVIGLAVGVVLTLMKIFQNLVGAFRTGKEEAQNIFNSLKNLISSILEGDIIGIVTNFADLFKNVFLAPFRILREFLPGFANDFIDWLTDLGRKGIDKFKDMTDGWVETVKNVMSRIREIVSDLMPSIDVSGSVSGIGSAARDVVSVNDFILSDGQIIEPHKDDTIIGAKDFSDLGGGGETTNIIVENPTVREDKDIDKIVEKVERIINRRTGGRSGLR